MIETLQSLRFVFVMMIFLSHFACRELQPFDAGGDCGVAFFFLLSGFVLSLGYGERIRQGQFSYRAFLRKRLLRSYVPHWFCLAFFLVVSGASADGKVLLNALLLQSWIPDRDYYFSCNSVSWFLSSLLFCYAVFPLVFRHVSKRLTAVLLAAYVGACWLTPADRINAWLYVHPLARFVDFYLGMALYRYYEHHQEPLPSAWAEPLVVLLLMGALAVYPVADAKLRNAPLYWLVLVPFILVFVRQQGVVSEWLRTRPMQWLGSLSMPLFLTHQMLIGILLRRLPSMPPVVMLAVCIFVVLMVSWGFQIIISKVLRL